MQTALAGFIEDGLLDKHIRRSRRVYADRYHILTEALSGSLADHLTVRTPNAGLHVAAMLREGLCEKEVLRVAARHGVAISGLRDCFHTGPSTIRPPDRIRRGRHHRPANSIAHSGPRSRHLSSG